MIMIMILLLLIIILLIIIIIRRRRRGRWKKEKKYENHYVFLINIITRTHKEIQAKEFVTKIKCDTLYNKHLL